MTFNKVKSIDKNIHWEIMHHDDAILYVTKEETRIDGPYEYGKKPVSGKKYTCHDILTTPI